MLKGNTPPCGALCITPSWGCSLCRSAVLLHPARAQRSSSAEENGAGRGSRRSLAGSREGVLGAAQPCFMLLVVAGHGHILPLPALVPAGRLLHMRKEGAQELGSFCEEEWHKEELFFFFFFQMMFETLKDTGQIIDVEKCESNAETAGFGLGFSSCPPGPRTNCVHCFKTMNPDLQGAEEPEAGAF